MEQNEPVANVAPPSDRGDVVGTDNVENKDES